MPSRVVLVAPASGFGWLSAVFNSAGLTKVDRWPLSPDLAVLHPLPIVAAAVPAGAVLVIAAFDGAGTFGHVGTSKGCRPDPRQWRLRGGQFV